MIIIEIKFYISTIYKKSTLAEPQVHNIANPACTYITLIKYIACNTMNKVAFSTVWILFK